MDRGNPDRDPIIAQDTSGYKAPALPGGWPKQAKLPKRTLFAFSAGRAVGGGFAPQLRLALKPRLTAARAVVGERKHRSDKHGRRKKEVVMQRNTLRIVVLMMVMIVAVAFSQRASPRAAMGRAFEQAAPSYCARNTSLPEDPRRCPLVQPLGSNGAPLALRRAFRGCTLELPQLVEGGPVENRGLSAGEPRTPRAKPAQRPWNPLVLPCAAV
jgi:hypothetical protein